MVALTHQMVRGKTRLESMDDVRNLNLWGQDLVDVSLLKELQLVEILSFSVNRIASLSNFRHCNELQELYLRKNEVEDISELHFLKGLQNLKVLWLSDNPIAEHPYYRQLAIRLLPSLEKLDSQEVSDMERTAAARNPELDKYMGSGGGPAVNTPPPQRRTPPAMSPQQQQQQQQGAPSPSRRPTPIDAGAGSRGGDGGGGGGGQRSKNILYAVMALMPELDMDDLIYVKREIEQRLGSGMEPGMPHDDGHGNGSGRREGGGRGTPPPRDGNGYGY